MNGEARGFVLPEKKGETSQTHEMLLSLFCFS